MHVKLSAAVNARQRALLHEAAEAAGIGHESRGDEALRCLHLGALTELEVHPHLTGCLGWSERMPRPCSVVADETFQKSLPQDLVPHVLQRPHQVRRLQVDVGPAAETISDADLAHLVSKHLSLEVPALQAPQAKRALRKVAVVAGQSSLSVSEFVEKCTAQLELEEAEEVAQAELELTSFSAAGAQVLSGASELASCRSAGQDSVAHTRLQLFQACAGAWPLAAAAAVRRR